MIFWNSKSSRTDIFVTNFLVNSGKLLRTVKESEFIKLFSEVSKSKMPMYSLIRKMLSMPIKTEFETLVSSIKKEL